METYAHDAVAQRLRRFGRGSAVATLAWALALHATAQPASPASLSDRQLQVIGRAAAFLQPPPAGGVVAVVYSAANPASRQDAEAIAMETGGAIDVAGRRLPARVVEVGALPEGGFAIVIAASGAEGPALGDAVRAAHLLCVTADLGAVQRGDCTMAVSTDLRVQIVLNHAAAAAAGINFAPAFRMMIREI